MAGFKLGSAVDQESHACGCLVEVFDSGARKESLCPSHQAAKEARLLREELVQFRRVIALACEEGRRSVERVAGAVDGLAAQAWYRPSLLGRLRALIFGRDGRRRPR